MKPGDQKYKEIPLKIVGGNKFGRYPVMSSEETFNMIISDGWNVPFAGYRNVQTINPTGQGRGIYSSPKLQKMFAVIDNNIYKFDTQLIRTKVGQTNTYSGDVFIAENNAGQVAISDLQNIYIYDNATNNVTQAVTSFTPGYITFQNGRFISPDTSTNQWRLSDPNNGLSWPFGSQYVGSVQTKPDNAAACIRVPGRGNMLYVFGRIVGEPWYDIGANLFPYQRSTSSNIDYGCLNPATIAEMDNIVCWLGANEKSGPVIMYTSGGDIKHISNDGIDFKLAELTNPGNSYGFMFKQDGHICYVLTFPDDNLTYLYDFNTGTFFTLTDEYMNYFIAKRVVFFNNKYYFVSFRDGNLYELSSEITNYDYSNDQIYEIPRIRVTPNIRLPDQSRFVCGYTGFTIEQGSNSTIQRVDMCVSKDGGVNFSSNVSKVLNPIGRRANRLMFWQLGAANDLVHQFRFWGQGRFVVSDGIAGIYQ
jgi:hypothetical protein